MKTYPVTDNRLPTLTSFGAKVFDKMRRIEPLVLVWWCLTLSILCASITRFTSNLSGFTHYALVIMGSGGCAWFWLFSRHLFRNNNDLRPRLFIVVSVVVFIEAIAALIPSTRVDGLANEVERVLDNAASMICIAALVFVWYEALQGYKETNSAAERRFRTVFITGFSLLVGITILWVSGAGINSFAAEWKAVLLTSCGLIALLGSRLAVQYRLRNPLFKAAQYEPPQRARTQTDTESSDLIAQRVLKAIRDEALLTTPNLKVSDFADTIGEQEYKVTRSITCSLKFRNFNHFLNSYRIDRAKQIFKDQHSRHLTIATIAYDCGFNSLGPFNRAFRQYTGMTPREFRLK